MSGYGKIRELCGEARLLAGDLPLGASVVATFAAAIAREKRLARLLEAALEVVEATEHLGYDITGPDPVAVIDKVGRALSRFRSLAEQEDQP